MSKVFGVPEQIKIKQIVTEGVRILSEIQLLQEGLKEAIENLAEEIDTKPAIIKKAIKVAMKGDWSRIEGEFEDLENVVLTSGHGTLP